MDFAIANWVFKVFGDSKFFLVASKIITLFGEWWAVCSIIIILLAFKKTRKVGIYAGVACLLAFCFNNLFLKNIVQRERPFETYEKFKSVCVLAGYNFPSGFSMASGHATATMALGFSVGLQSKKWGWLTLLYPVFVGLTRLVLCVHYATDVLVGFCIGICFAVASKHLLNFLNKLYLKRKGESHEKVNSSNQK